MLVYAPSSSTRCSFTKPFFSCVGLTRIFYNHSLDHRSMSTMDSIIKVNIIRLLFTFKIIYILIVLCNVIVKLIAKEMKTHFAIKSSLFHFISPHYIG